MKTITRTFLMLFSIIFIFSCCHNKGEEPGLPRETVNVKISDGESYLHWLPVGGDEEGANIIIQAENYEYSEITMCVPEDEGMSGLNYFYQPKPEFKGNEYVEILIIKNPTGLIKDKVESILAFNIIVQ